MVLIGECVSPTLLLFLLLFIIYYLISRVFGVRLCNITGKEKKKLVLSQPPSECEIYLYCTLFPRGGVESNHWILDPPPPPRRGNNDSIIIMEHFRGSAARGNTSFRK